jgi:hypothetical protein
VNSTGRDRSDRDGVALFPSGRWRGRWIWFETPKLTMAVSGPFPAPTLNEEESRSFGAFRRIVEVDDVPRSVPARLTADSRYVLWVNGTEACRGPIRGHSSLLHYDVVDLAPLLRCGRNVLAVLARFYGSATPWWAPPRPMDQLGAGALVFEANLGEQWVVSDADWKCFKLNGWQSLPPRGIGGMRCEALDAREMPHDWQEQEFDDSAWISAVELNAHHIGFQGHHEPPSQVYGPMLPRSIPQLGCETRVSRVAGVSTAPRADDEAHPLDQVNADVSRCTAGAPVTAPTASIDLDCASDSVRVLYFDFGEVVCGNVVLEAEAPAGARFDLAVTEFAPNTAPPSGEQVSLGLRYTAGGETGRFEAFDPIGFRYATLAVRADGPVKVRPLAVRERLYPRTSGPFFECSDETLNRVWTVGRRTVDLNSHDAYLDCPTREQRGWTGDFVVHQMVDLVSNPDWGLARRNVELAASPRRDGMLPMAAGGDIEHLDAAYIPDWALHWIRALHNLFRYTGDREFVRRMLPFAENVLRWFVRYRAEDGLLTDVNGWVIVDWSSVTVDGRSSVLNALWARGLRDFAEMCEWLGDEGRAGWARRLWQGVCDSFDRFWDEDRGVYVDHLLGGPRQLPLSQHAQAAAICASVVPEERVQRLVNILTDRSRHVHATWSAPRGDARRAEAGEGSIGGVYLFTGPPPPWWNVEDQIVVAQPFFRYVVHDALVAAGRVDLIPQQCLDWQALLDRCPTSLSETWFGGTTCHGWSATPTRDLSMRTLGVTPAEPGFGTARVAPRLGFLDWVRGAVPTPHGLLFVEVRDGEVTIDSPVPFDFDPEGGAVERYDSGQHTIRRR